jgi:tRNA uridine 5-carboxymethylaminomethyl modification enzyme
VARFKTGTPPRVDGRTVDFSRVELQEGDGGDYRFGSYSVEAFPEQRPCWITWTGEGLRRVIRENLERSALYGGDITGRGPRYCPSIEDKIVKFPDAPRHQVFLEPEGLETTELYVNGLSTSLPAEVQEAFLHTIPGLEEARITKLGYAIEYDYFPPHQLRHTLEVRSHPGLFFAGQINGTTGYEEAAGQGIVAGANAALQLRGDPPLILERDQAYIGVLVDDLVTKGVDEPYRLFTSRAEHRLLLRQDNAPERLGPIARDRGLLTVPQADALKERTRRWTVVREWFRETTLQPEEANPVLAQAGSTSISQVQRAQELMRRPGVRAQALAAAGSAPFDGGDELVTAVELEVKYEGYVKREEARVKRLRELAEFALPEDLPYGELVTLSREARDKLLRVRPVNMAQAGRIPGVSPADLQNLVREVRRLRRTRSTVGEDR